MATIIGTGIPSLGSYSPVRAINDPLSVPNNRIGIHILDTGEVESAAKLVNSSGGDWGYITIPIRSDDRLVPKWRDFFLRCRRARLIPILRLATYADGDSWTAPSAYDLVDFANFLNEMPWPTKNRYVILFNEPNHSKEWGGRLDPAGYAALLVQAKEIFRSRSENFFLLPAGLDMSAPTNHTSVDAFQFYRQMSLAVPDWISAVDGLAFHAYPNPGFLASPLSTGRFGITSYRHEVDYLTRRLGLLRARALPLFITETGHINPAVDFYTPAFTRVWTENEIVAITPFLLFAGSGDFSAFSFLDRSLGPTLSYQIVLALPKGAGSPLLTDSPFP